MEKLALQFKLDEKGNPMACLFRTKDGLWVWKKVSDFDEEEQIALIEGESKYICPEKNEKQTITKRQSA